MQQYDRRYVRSSVRLRLRLRPVQRPPSDREYKETVTIQQHLTFTQLTTAEELRLDLLAYSTIA
eukprot:COSAG06_NODE_11806_length_1462_cov_2.268525_2_plen_64_part_00